MLKLLDTLCERRTNVCDVYNQDPGTYPKRANVTNIMYDTSNYDLIKTVSQSLHSVKAADLFRLFLAVTRHSVPIRSLAVII